MVRVYSEEFRRKRSLRLGWPSDTRTPESEVTDLAWDRAGDVGTECKETGSVEVVVSAKIVLANLKRR
jgi:hypothetical protein